jgi:UDP-N-acetylmuramoylalanine--D-glutamate ligase
LRSFAGVEHRIELCGTRERDGVRFFNDSKATNLDSLEKALASFDEPIVLIAGGRDKNSDYDTLRPLVKERVAHLVTVGEAAPLIEKSWGGTVPFERASSMDEAVRRGAAAAGEGHVVLLSPACTSYDMYANFEERGRDFKACVKRLLATD